MTEPNRQSEENEERIIEIEIERLRPFKEHPFQVKDDKEMFLDNDETICKLSAPNLSSLSQGVEQGGYDVARLIDRLIRNPEAEWDS